DVLLEDGQRVVTEIVERGGEAAFVPADVANEDQARKLVEAAVKTFGTVDVLVNNAGIGGTAGRAHEMSAADFDRVINVNLRGTFLCTKFVIPHFLGNGQGCIVNIASTYGLI